MYTIARESESCYTIEMTRKIILCTTFRDFNGDDNDKIQRLFLKHLKNQTHTNWLLAATIFKEKNVPEALKEEGIPNVTFNSDVTPHKFSHTQVLLNGINALKKENGDILMWVSSDVLFEEDFLERVSASYDKKTSGISYPQTSYTSKENFKNRVSGRQAWYGIDAVYFSSDIFDDTCVQSIKDHPNNDWLYFEFFLLALGMAFSTNRVNLWPSGFVTIDNNYSLLGQTYQSTKSSGIKNHEELKKFIKKFNLSGKSYYKWILSYKMKSNFFVSLPTRTRIYFHVLYAGSYLRKIMPRIIKILKSGKFTRA